MLLVRLIGPASAACPVATKACSGAANLTGVLLQAALTASLLRWLPLHAGPRAGDHSIPGGRAQSPGRLRERPKRGAAEGRAVALAHPAVCGAALRGHHQA